MVPRRAKDRAPSEPMGFAGMNRYRNTQERVEMTDCYDRAQRLTTRATRSPSNILKRTTYVPEQKLDRSMIRL